MLTIYKSMIRSRVEYCCPLWNPINIQSIKAIESIQRTFTSKIKDCKHLNYWERLEYLDLFSLQRRRERYIIIHVWKVYQHIAPNDLDIVFYYNDRLGVKAKIPPLPKQSKESANTLYNNSFAVIGPTLWNILPRNVTLKDTLDSFKTALNKFLKTVPDRPPTPGYTSSNNNSLRDWTSQSGGLQMAR